MPFPAVPVVSMRVVGGRGPTVSAVVAGSKNEMSQVSVRLKRHFIPYYIGEGINGSEHSAPGNKKMRKIRQFEWLVVSQQSQGN